MHIIQNILIRQNLQAGRKLFIRIPEAQHDRKEWKQRQLVGSVSFILLFSAQLLTGQRKGFCFALENPGRMLKQTVFLFQAASHH